MPRSAEQTRDRIQTAAYKLFRLRGFSRVGVDEVAAAAKVTKRTLYYHFKSKDELLASVLESQHKMALTAFKSWGDKLSGRPEDIVDGYFRELAIWSVKPKWAGSGFTRLAFELADLPGHPARMVARRHKAILEKNLAGLLAKAGARFPNEMARDVWLLAEGAMAMILIHGDQAYAHAASRAARRLAGDVVNKKRNLQLGIRHSEKRNGLSAFGTKRTSPIK